MGPVSGIVLFLVIWFLVLFVVLPIRIETQGDKGEIVPGTQAGAPHNLNLKRKFLITTIASALVWAIAATIILTGAITVEDLDFFNRMGPPSAR